MGRTGQRHLRGREAERVRRAALDQRNRLKRLGRRAEEVDLLGIAHARHCPPGRIRHHDRAVVDALDHLSSSDLGYRCRHCASPFVLRRLRSGVRASSIPRSLLAQEIAAGASVPDLWDDTFQQRSEQWSLDYPSLTLYHDLFPMVDASRQG